MFTLPLLKMWRPPIVTAPGVKGALSAWVAAGHTSLEGTAVRAHCFSSKSSSRSNSSSSSSSSSVEEPADNGGGASPEKNSHPFTKLHRLAGTHKASSEEGGGEHPKAVGDGSGIESWFGQWPTKLFRTASGKAEPNPSASHGDRHEDGVASAAGGNANASAHPSHSKSPGSGDNASKLGGWQSDQANTTSPLSSVLGGRVNFRELPSSLNEVTNTVIRTGQQVLESTNTAVVTVLSTAAAPLTPNAPKTPSKEHLVYEDIKSLVKLTDWEDITAHSSSASEVTLYVKGFLQEGDSPDKFVHWMGGHRELCDRRNWGPLAYGHHWQSGRRPQVTDFIPPVTSFLLLSRASPILKVPTPGTLAAATAASLAADAALIVWRFASQYYSAIENARGEARSLSIAIDRLTSEYDTVRIVAHSLGCRHVIEAVCELPHNRRPQEIHLLAPACRESDVEDKLSHLAQGPTFLYYCQRDYILAMLFRTFSLGYALGQYGPQREYADLHAVDVGGHFGFYVHMYYRQVFQEFLRDSKLRQQMDQQVDNLTREGA